ncbi:DUF4097 family beta strand repeat-containing protein [Pseudonocardia sp. ICBG1293]|uniref:DUF4097 family beta strand repeat-containing protein n=1 Tax=Pseudonocardia sp. ICBG1293 TaxID=2844382 RepID=UPI001CCFFA72|nr:DUF4097 family beta strand repeat-containing protein [Pseudonocardia sp. ICBG1293]
MPTYQTPEPVTAVVDLTIGELRVTASDRTDTVVEVRSSEADRAHADRVRVELTGRELHVTGPPLGLLQKLTPRTPGRSIEVGIALPAGSALTATTAYGGIVVEGPLGACEARTRYGDVRVDDAGSADLTADHGHVRIGGTVTGDATVRSDHGGMRVHRIDGTATLTSKHGDIRAEELAGEAVLTGTHGTVDVDELGAGARVRTAYGAVRLGRVHRGEVSLTSTHGRLEIGIAAGSAAWLDLDTTGRVGNDLDPRDAPDGDGVDTVTVHARSREGDIVVRRA